MTLNIKIPGKDYNNTLFQYLGTFLLSIYPITFFFGNGVLNTCIILIDIVLILELLKEKNLKFLNCLPFYSLIFLWIVLIINLIFFSIDSYNSIPRTLGFIRFIFFVFAIIYFFNISNGTYQKIILSSWLTIFAITSIDLIYEISFGSNILGFVSYMPGRLAGFFNDELIMGHYYCGFILIILTYLFQILKKKGSFYFQKINLKFSYKNLIYVFIFLFLIITMLIGERSNFIKSLIMVFVFTLLLNRDQIKKKILLILSVILIFFILIFNNQQYKVRFVTQLISPIINNPINFVTSSKYWDHYSAGINIFKDNKIFGVGLKNYRIYAKDKNYKDPSNHPHQSHIEILSELGLMGYFSFLLFFIINIRNSIQFNNIYNSLFKLSGFLFLVVSFIPLLPSGSFFTSHAAAIFWMNFSLILYSKDSYN